MHVHTEIVSFIQLNCCLYFSGACNFKALVVVLLTCCELIILILYVGTPSSQRSKSSTIIKLEFYRTHILCALNTDCTVAIL